MASWYSVRGTKARGDRDTARDAELNLAVGSTRIKETHNGREEEESEEEVEVIDVRAASYWGSAVSFGFREAPYRLLRQAAGPLVWPLLFCPTVGSLTDNVSFWPR
jgi:hypothetical protein